MQTLHISSNLQVIHLLSNNIMYCKWIGPQSQQSVLRGGAVILDLLQQKQFTKVLNDNTRVTGPWNTAVQWTAEQWFPAMITSGLQQFAWIISPNIFARLSAKRAAPPTTVIKSFNDYQAALHWLTNAG